MAKKGNTKKALLMSALSLLLCVSMLVGTTFAWFTDTASSGLNQIIAGNLDVELLYKNDGVYENAKDVKLFDDIELWEPGMVAYETIKIANVGTLALKYAMSINTGNENTLNGHGLSEVLHFAVIDGEVSNGATREEVLELAEASGNKGMLTTYVFGEGKSLEADTESDPVTLVVYWPHNGEIDNLYNVNNGQKTSDGEPLHIDLGLTVVASQETVEEDSFDKYYDDTASYPQNMWLGDVAEKLVIDAETKTISISSGAELAKLAQVVNAGTDYDGYTVKLTDSIDLGNIAWTPIGAAGTPLKADVDGQGHKIYNLNVSGGEKVGLFGELYTANITNVHVVNAEVTGNHYVGAVVGKLSYGSITKCSVTNAKVVATPNVTGAEYDNGDKAGGVVGWVAEGNYVVSENTAENVYVKAYRDMGGIVGFVGYLVTVENNKVSNIDILVDQSTGYYGTKDFNAGAIAGRLGIKESTGETATIRNNEEIDVTIGYSVTVADADALKNALAAGADEIVLLDNIAIDADTPLTIAKDTETVLDLNGKTLSAVSDEGKASRAIDNKGTLTIKNGIVTYKGVGDPNFGYGTNTINNSGELIIEGATIINTTENGSSVAIDNYANAKLTVNSGEIKSVKNAIRLCPFSSGAIDATINGGTITGARAIQIQLPSNRPEDAPEINLTVNGGTLNGTGGLAIYSYSAGQSFANVNITLNGGIYNNDVAFGGGAKATKENVTIGDNCVFNADVYRYLENDGIEWLFSDGIVADTEELQFALDNAIDGATIYLQENVEYGDVVIRANKASELTGYYYIMGNYDSSYYGQAGWQYAKRTINDLTIVGAEGAVINSLTTTTPRDDSGNALGTRNNLFEINNLTISGVTFTKGVSFNTSDVEVAVSETEAKLVPGVMINGLTLEGCKLNSTADKETGAQLLGIANTAKTASNAKDIVVRGCVVDGAYNGIYIVDGINVLIENNSFSNIGFNAVHINDMCGGNIVVRNNVITGCTDRVFRLSGIQSGEITIMNNTITNSPSDGGQYIKASTLGETANMKWDNNTADGKEIVIKTNEDGEIIGTVSEN